MDLKKCLYCGNIIQFNSLRVSDYNKKKFCNNCCAASYNNRRRKKKKKYCLVCGKEVPLRNKFCSVQCYHYLQYSNYIKKWKSDQLNGMTGKKWKDLSSHIRRYLFEKYENKCARCGWSEINPYTGTLPLEVEHIDGDATNNREENLILLCPNCHSLTETYRGANKGNGTRNIKWLSLYKETTMLSFILDNTVLKVIFAIVVFVWVFEVFLLPFKLNRYFTRHKELCNRMERIENFLREICSDSKNLQSIEKFCKLAFGLTSKKVFVDENKKKEDHP